MSVLYVGKRTPDGARVLVENGKGRTDLPPRNDLINHSPNGFEWGYGGSGPAQLALALCVHALDGDAERALRVYQEFKFAYIATLNDDEREWAFTRDQVRQWIEYIEAGHAEAARAAQA